MAKKKMPSLTHVCIDYLINDDVTGLREIIQDIKDKYGVEKRSSNVSYAFNQLYNSDLGYFMHRTGRGGQKDPFEYQLSDEGLKLTKKMAYRLYLSNDQITLENLKYKVPKLTETIEASKDPRTASIVAKRWGLDLEQVSDSEVEVELKPKSKKVSKTKSTVPEEVPSQKTIKEPVVKEPVVKEPATKAKKVLTAVSKSSDDTTWFSLCEKLLDTGVTIRHSFDFNLNFKI